MKKFFFFLTVLIFLGPQSRVFAAGPGILPSSDPEFTTGGMSLFCEPQYLGKSDDQLQKMAEKSGESLGTLQQYRNDMEFYISFFNDPDNGLEVFSGATTEDTVRKKAVIREVLACALKSGYIKWWMYLYFVIYAIEYVLNIAGLLSVLMIILGGYYYISGGMSGDTEKGKSTIRYAIIGLVVTLSAWTATNLLLYFLTS